MGDAEDSRKRAVLEELKRLIAEQSVDWQTHYDLGVAYTEMGLIKEAVGEFEAVLRQLPSHEPAKHMLEQLKGRSDESPPSTPPPLLH